MLLTTELLESVNDVKEPIRIEFPELETTDGKIPYCCILHMNSEERDAYDVDLRDVQSDIDVEEGKATVRMEGFRSLLLYHTMVDDAGKKIFKSLEQAREILKLKSSSLVERVWQISADLNGLSGRAVDNAKGNLNGQSSEPESGSASS